MGTFFSRNKAAVVFVVAVALIHVFGSGSGSLARPPPRCFFAMLSFGAVQFWRLESAKE